MAHLDKVSMKRLLLFIIFLALLCPAAAVPADVPASKAQPTEKGISTTAVEPSVKPATLKVNNRSIFTFRSPLFGYSPGQRVEGASARITAVVDRGLAGPVTEKKVADGILILIGEQAMFVITPGDLNTLAGETTDEAGRKVITNLTTALAETMESSRADVLLRGTGYTLAASVALVLALAGIRLSRRWLSTHLAEVVGPRLKTLAIGGFTQHIDGIILFIRGVIGITAWALAVISLYLWLTFSFKRFPYSRPWGEQLHNYMINGVKVFLLTVVDFIPGLVIVAAIFLITRFLVRIGRLFFDAVESGRVTVPGLYSETAQPTRRIVTVILWLFAVVMMYPYLPGSDSDAFKGVSVFVGLLLSIGSAGTVNQAVSGLMLMYSRALRAGDYVQIGETEGTVLSLGMFSTRIRTPKNELISIPNAVIVGTTTKNYTRENEAGAAIVTTSVTIGYNAPWRQVHAMLIEAAHRTVGLMNEPTPRVLQRSLSDFYVEYMLGARIAEPHKRIAVLDELHRNIQDVFNEYGVQIMSPHYVADPAEKVWVPKDKWYEAPAEKDEENR
jgi:small-conductance mechanosensitive channel